ncbi:response regulator [Desulfonatronovibrio magnus]|uniref:response regulator n=1 Tax=Desulfonatronovibrio magnus TaxID=698827 RepID=UPI0005EB3245|nr:response regulator [Desulfonatronovibrio magnus]
MPAIHLLLENKVMENRIKSAMSELLPHMEVTTRSISSFSGRTSLHNEINIFVVETGCPSIDYQHVAESLRTVAQNHGVAVLAVYSQQSSQKDAGLADIGPDSTMSFPFEDSYLSAQLEALIKISELRAMNQNLGAQLSQRVSKLAGLEQQLRHTNWILEALNKCGEVIIKANEEIAMLEQVCAILGESLENCLVMVGYAEMDAESSVRIIASGGEKKEMVQEMKISWAADPMGQEPTGSAIRTGTSILVQNPVNDVSTTPWKDLFARYDIKYILSLPVAHAGVGFGALSIYGGMKAEFSRDDIAHLERVAQNMGYGIWFLRHRKKRKMVENELQKTNELFSLAMEATEDALWDWDVVSGNAYFSPRWYTMLGYEPNELPMNYDSFRQIVHPDDIDAVENKLGKAMEDGENYSLEFRALTRHKDICWILARGKIVSRDSDNKPIRIVGTHFDITERKKMEQEIEEAKSRAETANQAKDKFLEAMSHELRTPLNGIMSILQTLMESDLQPSEKEYIGMALDSSRQLLVSINKILELSTLQKGLYCTHKQPFDIVEEMTKITGYFLPIARNKDLYLDLDLAEELPPRLIGDISIIRQIIWNLMDNAIKFTQKGGVLLKVTNLDPAGGQAGDNGHLSVMFEVIDSGIGIPSDVSDDIFEPFGINESAHQKRRAGYGVGLSVCKQLADTIGASIGYESTHGQGSRFHVLVDLVVQVEDAAPAQDYVPSHDTEKLILVVEDEKINLMLIEKMLRKKGYTVVTAMDGDEAVEVMQSRPDISLVLMDIMVPKYDGFELTRMIREGKFSGISNVPVIAVTALADSESRQKCFDSGMNAYLSKPIDNQELMGMVSKYIEAF